MICSKHERTAWTFRLLLGLLSFSCSAAFSADPFPPGATGAEISSGLPSGYEPSGVVWHFDLEKLLVVSDEGIISSMNSDGSDVSNYFLSGSPDLEGITVADPNSPFVYLGLENPDSIVELNINTGTVTRSFNLTPWMTGPSNQGLEALTFVPDPNDPEGGIFYAGLQDDGKIYSFRLPISSSSSSTSVTHLGTITPVAGRTDLSGLHYDSNNEVLYAIYDSSNLLRAMEADATFLAEWELAGNDQEGISFAGDTLFISEDSEEVWKYAPFPILLRAPSADFDEDLDIDGADFLTLQRGFGQWGFLNDGDATGDSLVNANDLTVWEQQYGGTISGSSNSFAVPEPATLTIQLSFGAFFLNQRRRCRAVELGANT